MDGVLGVLSEILERDAYNMNDFCSDCGATINHFFYELVFVHPKHGNKYHANSVKLWCQKCGQKKFGGEAR
jgi:hypothetical protein